MRRVAFFTALTPPSPCGRRASGNGTDAARGIAVVGGGAASSEVVQAGRSGTGYRAACVVASITVTRDDAGPARIGAWRFGTQAVLRNPTTFGS